MLLVLRTRAHNNFHFAKDMRVGSSVYVYVKTQVIRFRLRLVKVFSRSELPEQT